MADRHVCVFSTNFLEYSQTFVYDELRHHERWTASVVCHRRLNEDRFPYPDLLAVERPGLLGRAEGLLYKATANSPSVVSWIRRHRADLLHAHFGPGSMYALGPAAMLDLPLVVTYHGYDVPILATRERTRPRFWRYWAWSSWMMRRVDRFLPASEELAQMLVDLGAPPERVHLWRLGVTIPEQWSPRPLRDDAKIVMVGRFVEKKGFANGVRAFAKIAHRFPRAKLQLVGDGPERATIEALVARHKLEQRVELLGVLPHNEVFRALEAADILLAPSVVDSRGNRESGLLVVKEANARGLPAVGTIHGGIPEIIDDGRTGYLVAEHDEYALADRLARLLGDPEHRRAMGVAARAKMEREYDIVQRVRVLEDHYDEVLDQRRVGAATR